MPVSLPDITTEADVKTLVDAFYDKVNQDELLSPIFNGFARVNWAAHMPQMYTFWSSILLGTANYHGRPFPKHIPLPIDGTHFQRWLQLFFATLDEHFAGPVADEARLRARNLATLFETRLGHRPLSIL